MVYLVVGGCLLLVCGGLLVVCGCLLVVCDRLLWFEVVAWFSNYSLETSLASFSILLSMDYFINFKKNTPQETQCCCFACCFIKIGQEVSSSSAVVTKQVVRKQKYVSENNLHSIGVSTTFCAKLKIAAIAKTAYLLLGNAYTCVLQ